MIPVKKLHADAVVPKYAYEDDAAVDLYAVEEVTLHANQRGLIPTGIAMAIPKKHVGLLWDRSSMAAKFGITTLAGVIDSNYRGEIKVVLQNLTSEDIVIEKGQRIAQMLIQPVLQRQMVEVEDLEESSRNEKGFGSSGK